MEKERFVEIKRLITEKIQQSEFAHLLEGRNSAHVISIMPHQVISLFCADLDISMQEFARWKITSVMHVSWREAVVA